MPESIILFDDKLDLRTALSKLQPTIYLNDEIINFMINLVGRVVPSEEFSRRVVIQNTFFYKYASEPANHNDA